MASVPVTMIHVVIPTRMIFLECSDPDLVTIARQSELDYIYDMGSTE